MPSAGRLRFGRPGSVPPSLQAVAEEFGAWTTASRGGVRLNGDIGFIVSGTPTSWKVRITTGDASHWVFAGTFDGTYWVVSEGASALTPMPSSAGRTAKLNGGPYVFEVIATNDFGDSTPVSFTRTINANAANIGDSLGSDSSPANVFGGASIATFELGTTAGQRKILISKGVATREVMLQAFNFTSEVKVMDADALVPSNLTLIRLVAGSGTPCSFITVDGFTNDLNGLGSYNCRFTVSGSNDIVFQNLQVGRTVVSANISLSGIFIEGSVNARITVRDCKFYWMTIGVKIDQGSDLTVQRCTWRWGHARFMEYASVNGLLVEDINVLSPRMITGSGLHGEGFQRHDTTTSTDVVFRRLRVYAADATFGHQGFFAGSATVTPDTNFQLACFAFAGWLGNGIYKSSNAGTSNITTTTLMKMNTGYDTLAPPGETFTPAGPSLFISANPVGMWAGTFTVDHTYVYDGYSNINFGAATFDTPTMRASALADPSAYFLNGNPRDLEAIPFATWEAMSDEDVIAAFDAALLPSAAMDNADHPTGAFLADGSWNE